GLAPNPALLPERAVSGDLGVAWETRVIEASVTAYYGLYENLITYEFFPPNLPRPYNVPGADVGGTESTLRFTPWRFFAAEANWTWMRTRDLREDPRYHLKALPYRPEHRGHLRLEGGPQVLRVHATLEAQSAQFASRDHRTEIPARALVHAGMTWRTGSAALPLELVFEARNLTDARVHDLAGYPLPPRAFHLSLRAHTGAGGGARTE
ncbi:MAG TPA: TonB-dependent receptor, partial [Myxococcaceae bacterium]|nr:TonB-dependent receptor [Myxococcaceae bacterium]